MLREKIFTLTGDLKISVKIKICGITNLEDISLLEAYPVDYLGFILYPPSPRYVGKRLPELLKAVKKAKKVAVFVDASYEEIKETLDQGVDLIQLHGKETLDLAKKIGLNRILKAFKVKDSLDYNELTIWKDTYALLLDTYIEGVPGGTGKTFNWEIAKEVVMRGYRIFLAGGLNPENVLEALSKVRPYGIDLSSGLEKKPGKKDPEKVKALFERLKGVTTPFQA